MVRPTTRTLLIAGMAVSLAMAGGLTYFASEHPDGLEWVAGRLGMGAEGRDAGPVNSLAPMPDYTAPGIDGDSHLSAAVAGIVGTLLMFAAGCGLGLLLRRPRYVDSEGRKAGVTGASR